MPEAPAGNSENIISPELRTFRAEISRRKDEEAQKEALWEAARAKGEKPKISFNIHFNEIEPESLEEEDRLAYESLDILPDNAFIQLRSERLAKLRSRKVPPDALKSIFTFWAYMGNEIMGYQKVRSDYEKKHNR